MKTNSKNKGSSFERLISKKLSLFFSNNTNDSIFYRSFSSGAVFTNRYKKGSILNNNSSDITCVDDTGKLLIDVFSIECKHYKDIDLWSLLSDTNSTIFKWWIKLNDECKINNKQPLLITKQNNKPILCFTNEFVYNNILNIDIEINYKLKIRWNDLYLYCFLFDDILNLDIEKFKQKLINVK